MLRRGEEKSLCAWHLFAYNPNNNNNSDNGKWSLPRNARNWQMVVNVLAKQPKQANQTRRECEDEASKSFRLRINKQKTKIYERSDQKPNFK